MKTKFFLFLICFISVVLTVPAQNAADSETADFNKATLSAQAKLDESIAELARVREKMAEETIPLNRELNELQNELTEVRLEFQQTTRLLDSRTLDLTNLQSEIKSRREESTYLSNLLGEYIRNFESRLHIAELQRYDEELKDAKLALENTTLSEQEVYEAQAKLLSVSLERLHDGLGGTRFDGRAVDADGYLQNGTFLLLGPAALFVSKDGKTVGTAEQRLGSLEPAVIAFQDPLDAKDASLAVADASGAFPFDPTLGNAHKVEQTEETFAEHVKKGGPVMIPIFALAGISMLVALCKWLSFLFIHHPPYKQIRALLDAVAKGDQQTAKNRATVIRKSKPSLVTGWMFGFIVGGLLGAGSHFLLTLPPAATITPSLVATAAAYSIWTFAIVLAILGACLELILRFVLGYSPVGSMLEAGVEHLEYPPELIEEVMFEKVLATRIKLESFLSLIAISASAAPLLGLLGTVTGIINTFKLITVFGSGDVKTLSGGISEALITTEFGLIAAIPALLIHGFLSRKSRSVINEMEKAGVALINQISKTPLKAENISEDASTVSKKEKTAIDQEKTEKILHSEEKKSATNMLPTVADPSSMT